MSRRHVREDSTDTETRTENDVNTGEQAHDRFGGINWGASFFGWLVAIALTVLLSSIIAAVASAISDNANLTQTRLSATPAPSASAPRSRWSSSCSSPTTPAATWPVGCRGSTGAARVSESG